MRPLIVLLLGPCSLLVTASPARAVDYGRIPRTLVKEPVYKSASPRYALLLFGAEAKVRVWVVVDGDALYLDRNGDGDLTQSGERFPGFAESTAVPKGVTLSGGPGTVSYTITRAALGTYPRECLSFDVSIAGTAPFFQYGVVNTADRSADACLVHFDGPLTIRPVATTPAGVSLRAGRRATDLKAAIGTFTEEHGGWAAVRTTRGIETVFPRGLKLDAQLPAKRAGAEPVRLRYSLQGLCCTYLFHGPVPLPEDAGPGTARLTLSFEGWTGRPIASSNVEVPVLPSEDP